MAKETIVLVDDDETATNSLANLLRKESFKVYTAFDGAAGVKAVEKYQPALVLLDVEMPSLNGFEVLEQIKLREVRTRVVIITGYYITPSDIVKGMKGGACDYIVKPIDVNVLVHRIRGLLLTEDTINVRLIKLNDEAIGLLRLEMEVEAKNHASTVLAEADNQAKTLVVDAKNKATTIVEKAMQKAVKVEQAAKSKAKEFEREITANVTLVKWRIAESLIVFSFVLIAIFGKPSADFSDFRWEGR